MPTDEERLSRIEAALEHVATREDVQGQGAGPIRWMPGTRHRGGRRRGDAGHGPHAATDGTGGGGARCPERPIVILHGWSDTSQTFEPLARLLRARLAREVSIVSLADYVSMEDEVRFDDVAEAMDVAWRRHGLPRRKGAVDAVVHSSGGLVIRDWGGRRDTTLRRTD